MPNCLLRSITVLLSVTLYASMAMTLSASEQVHRVKVTIVLRESSLHSSVVNRDSYLIQVSPKSGKAFTARMIDEYPSYEDKLPYISVSDGAAFSVALRRASYCDDLENAGSSIRCFAVVHGSWKVPKGQHRDEWWK